MIIARGTSSSHEIIVLGISDENVKRLLQGQPITLTRESHGDGIPDGLEILLFHGKTEQDMVKILKQHGLIDDMTNVFKDKRLDSL